ncbi:MAG: WYL domain-containing protein, partial [Lachnospiraceae bacterium]|nr:WYL domain-containing protein [Candidatus Hippenecus merdae]
DGKDGKIKHFRVDKMLRLSVTDKKREGEKEFKDAAVESYSTRMFGMFSGKDERVTLEAENRFAGILIDRFGKDIMMIPTDPEHFRATVNVSVSEQFLSWVFSLGEGIRITGPEKVLVQARDMLARLTEEYR